MLYGRVCKTNSPIHTDGKNNIFKLVSFYLFMVLCF